VLGDDEGAAGVAIQPVHEPRPPFAADAGQMLDQ
jgi:hypothetical protein